jgi:hypothetical protein
MRAPLPEAHTYAAKVTEGLTRKMARIAFAILRSKEVSREITAACNELQRECWRRQQKGLGELAFR